jgi:hypothetical protein
MVSSVRKRTRALLLIFITVLALGSLGPGVRLPTATAATTQSASTPEVLLSGFTATGATRNASRAFVASQGFGIESCTLDGTQLTTVVRSLSFAGLAQDAMVERCTFAQKGMVADNDYLYFRDGDNGLKRMPAGGGAVELLLADTCCGGLALDEDYVYFGDSVTGDDDDQIIRVSKAEGLPAIVASTANPNSIALNALAVDDENVYWAEGGIGQGEIKLAPKGGGAVETLAGDDDGIDNAIDIALDEDYVYWAEFGSGKVRRVAKAGGAVLDLAPGEASYRAQSLAVNDSYVYFSDTDLGYGGRIRRVATGGGPIEDLAIGLLAPSDVFLTEAHVYWIQHDGLYRLPLDAPSVAVDLTIEAIEVNQAVQNMDNDVPLIADKSALVRAYPRADLVARQARAILRLYKNGVELAGSPIASSPESVLVRTSGGYRRDMDTTFNFYVPRDLLDGSVELRAEINHDGAVTEADTSNNTFSRSFGFQAKKPLCIEVVRVETLPSTGSANNTGFSEIVDWVRASYPVPDVLIDIGGQISEAGGPYEMSSDGSKVLNRLDWYRAWHNHAEWTTCGRAHFYGLIHRDLAVGGLGRLNGYVAWGSMNVNPAFLGPETPDWFAPWGGLVMAHEVAHNRGREHVACGSPDDVDAGYPYDPCDLGPDELDAYFGYHLYERALIQPGDVADIMSYAHQVDRPSWISDYTYRGILNDLPDARSAAPANVIVTPSAQLLAISGYITPTEGVGSFEFGYRVPSDLLSPELLANPPFAPTPAQYTLRLLGAGESVLFSKPIALDDRGEHGPSEGFFTTLPFNSNTKAIALFDGENELARREVSASAPVVEVLSPNGGESLAGATQIEWNASDADGDALVFTVQYSPDDGKSWQMVATGVTASPLVLDDLSFLPGTQGLSGRIRVIASDGVNTGVDTSDKPFSLRPQPPAAFISTPTEGAVFGKGDPISLEGGAFDEEDGSLEGAALVWKVGGANVGTGRAVTLSSLPVGQHSVTLEATSSDGLKDTTSTTIYVRPQDCLVANSNLDLLFVRQGNLSPGQEAAIQAQIDATVAELKALGLTLRHGILCTTCAEGGAAALDPETGVDHPADWGAAVVSGASFHAWREGYARLIVPIHSSGPENGNPVEDPGADRAIVAQAIAAANRAGAAVAPWIVMPVETLGLAALRQLDADLAADTGGDVIDLGTSAKDAAQTLAELHGRLGCDPEVDRAIVGAALEPGSPLAVSGRNLWPGTQVLIDGRPARALSYSPDGSLLRFALPAGYTPAGRPKLGIARPGTAPLSVELPSEAPQPQREQPVFLPLIGS